MHLKANKNNDIQFSIGLHVCKTTPVKQALLLRVSLVSGVCS